MSANDFVPIRVSTLRGELNIDFDTYLKVADKYILYCRNGENFIGEQLKRIRKKKIKKLYIKAEDEGKYRTYLVQSIDAAYENRSIPMDARSEVIQGAQQAITEEVIENPHDPAVYEVAKQNADRYIQFLLNENEALKSILNIENPDNNIAHHGVNVASLALAIAQKLDLTNKHSMQLLTVGCFIHDFDHYHTGIDISKSLDHMSAHEKDTYLLHPLSGAERLIKYKHFDREVLEIVMQHEELVNSKGFPKGLDERKIAPMAIIAGVANTYDKMVNFEGAEPKDAVKRLIWEKVGLYPLNHLEALRDVLNERGISN